MPAMPADRRARISALLALLAAAMLAAGMAVGVPESFGDRVLAPLLVLLVLVSVLIAPRRTRMLLTIVAAGVPAGLALGAGLRLAMFIAAVMGGGVERTLAGTLGMVAFGAMPGVILSAVVVQVRRFVEVRPAWLAATTTVLGGGMLLASARAELAARGVLAVNLLTFLLPLAATGCLVALLQPRVEAWWDRNTAQRRATPPAETASGASEPAAVP